jgi:hypothetical protein
MFNYCVRVSILAFMITSLHSTAMQDNHIVVTIQHQDIPKLQVSWLTKNPDLRRAVAVIYGLSVFTLSQIPGAVCSSSACSPTADTLSQIISCTGAACALFGAYHIAPKRNPSYNPR